MPHSLSILNNLNRQRWEFIKRYPLEIEYGIKERGYILTLISRTAIQAKCDVYAQIVR